MNAVASGSAQYEPNLMQPDTKSCRERLRVQVTLIRLFYSDKMCTLASESWLACGCVSLALAKAHPARLPTLLSACLIVLAMATREQHTHTLAHLHTKQQPGKSGGN